MKIYGYFFRKSGLKCSSKCFVFHRITQSEAKKSNVKLLSDSERPNEEKNALLSDSERPNGEKMRF